jgi:hypothetical protein
MKKHTTSHENFPLGTEGKGPMLSFALKQKPMQNKDKKIKTELLKSVYGRIDRKQMMSW